jgi:threonine 3-dehydrogenase
MPIRSEHDGDRDHLRLTLGDRTAEGPALGHGDAIAVHLFDRDVLARPVDPVFDAFVREVIGDDTLALFRVEAPEYAGGGHRASLLARASVADLGARLGDEALDARRIEEVQEALGMKEGFDVGLEMSGNPDALHDMLANMCHGGKIALLGLPDHDVALDWNAVIHDQITIKGVFGREMYETWYMMTVMLQGGLDVAPAITHRFHYTAYEEAFEAVRSGNAGKVLLYWREEP